MPLTYQKIWSETHKAGVWKIEEDHQYFLDKLIFNEAESKLFTSLSEKRQIEWLASRLLISQLSNNYHTSNIVKDSYGKPHLKDSHVNISISHSYDHVAAILSVQKVGIDIQKKVDKITRIAHKYLNRKELHAIPDEVLTDVLLIQWGAKEALYKAYGRKALEYREDIRVVLTDELMQRLHVSDQYPISYEGYICKGALYESYQMTSYMIADFFLTYGIER